MFVRIIDYLFVCSCILITVDLTFDLSILVVLTFFGNLRSNRLPFFASSRW